MSSNFRSHAVEQQLPSQRVSRQRTWMPCCRNGRQLILSGCSCDLNTGMPHRSERHVMKRQSMASAVKQQQRLERVTRPKAAMPCYLPAMFRPCHQAANATWTSASPEVKTCSTLKRHWSAHAATQDLQLERVTTSNFRSPGCQAAVVTYTHACQRMRAPSCQATICGSCRQAAIAP